MSRINSHLKKGFGLFVLACVVTILSAATGYSQEREPVLLNLGVLTTFSDVYVTRFYDVPEGKRLVIEQVFLQFLTPTRATGKLQVVRTRGGSATGSYFPFLFVVQGTGGGGDTILTASHPMKLYIANPAGDGITVRVRFYVGTQTSGSSSSGRDATISGYLEPAGPPPIIPPDPDPDPAPTP